MNIVLRTFLVIVALAALVLVLRKLRKSEMQVIDSIFWFLFAGSLVVLALIPQIAYFFSGLFGFDAPSNFVFFYVIGVLVLREFSLTVKVAHLRMKLNTLIQEIALRDEDAREKRERGC